MAAVVTLVAGVFTPLVGQSPDVITLGEHPVDVPTFSGYEVEYGSAFGRFFNQVRPFDLDGTPKISVLNIIDMPGAVIVDSRVIDRASMRLEHMTSPFFAWGQEFIVGHADADGFDWVRVPLGGGEPQRVEGRAAFGGFVDDLGFSPTLAAFLPQPVGAMIRLPALVPYAGGVMRQAVFQYEVVGRETLELENGVRCECWVLENNDTSGALHRSWVSREPPFLIKRHRDIGGPRDFVSEVLTYRVY